MKREDRFRKVNEVLKRYLFDKMNGDLRRKIQEDLKKDGITAKIRFRGCVVVAEIGNDIVTLSSK